MDVFEITGYQTGVSKAGVNYLQPSDSFQNIEDGFIYRQVLQSRQGFSLFAPRLANNTRLFGIFEHTLTDGTTQLLAVDQNFLYKYNTGTGIFDPIPFAGSMAAYAGFAITAKDFYVSGVSYPAAQFLSTGAANPAYVNQGSRFIICGEGITPNVAGSAIFFYNGTDVRDFTSLADNPNYAAPIEGPLTRATYVLWFNERLNFVIPVINAVEYSQGVLYSGIKNINGNGDKFNVPGAGLFQADTYQEITGANIVGQIIVLNLSRSAYTLEKTSDAFNPYFGRLIPGVLGTNAKFSAVSWNEAVNSMGKTGILNSDGRNNLRIDNKIPRFTADEIDQLSFNLTYGGFDRINNQFLWAYKISETDSDTQNSILVQNYEEDSWSKFKARFSVFGQSEIGLNLTWDEIDETMGNESWATWDTTEELWDRIGLGLSVQKTLAGDDLGYVYEINQDLSDYHNNISAIAAGATTTLTISNNAYIAGDKIYIAQVEGMTEINNFDPSTNDLYNNLYNIISSTGNDIEINVDSTLFTAYTMNGYVSKPILFYAETIPFNPYRQSGRRCYVGFVEFFIETTGGKLLLDVYADQEQTPFIQDAKLNTTGTSEVGEWVSLSINQESNFLTFVLKQNVPEVQLKVTSMRLHCDQGGMTSG